MLAMLSFLAAAVAFSVLAPLVLTLGRWQARHPRTALTLWFCAFFAGIGCLAGSEVVAILCSVGIGEPAQPVEALVMAVVGWSGLGALGAVIVFVCVSAEPLTQSWHAAVRDLAPVAVSRERFGKVTLVWFAADEPVACAVPSAEPEILVSTALLDVLSGPQLRAVLAHESAHLRQHHGWAVRIAEINALCVSGWFPAGRALKRATLLLVELIADDDAARRVGAVHLANALAIMGRVTGDPGMRPRADRLTLHRWRSPRHTSALTRTRAA